MDVIHDCPAGLDLHKDSVVACVRAMSGTRATRECRTYATTTEGLLALLEWLSLSRCGVAAMEATGVYWLPVFKILSEGPWRVRIDELRRGIERPGRARDRSHARYVPDFDDFHPGAGHLQMRVIFAE